MTQALPTAGLAQLSVIVTQVQRDVATVRDTSTGKTFTVRRDVMRAKGAPPAVGENWIVTRDYGNVWTFACIIGAGLDVYYDPQPTVSLPVAAPDFSNIVLPSANLVVINSADSLLYRYDGTTWVSYDGKPKAVCRVRFGLSSFALGIGDTVAQGDWVAYEDPMSMFHVGGTVPTPFSYIQIPIEANYRIQYHCELLGASSGYAENRILRNYTNDLNSTTLNYDDRQFRDVAVGLPLDAYRHRIHLQAGDKIFWHVWVSIGCNMLQSRWGQSYTEISVVYDGPVIG